MGNKKTDITAQIVKLETWIIEAIAATGNEEFLKKWLELQELRAMNDKKQNN